jgi:hypothetical protein
VLDFSFTKTRGIYIEVTVIGVPICVSHLLLGLGFSQTTNCAIIGWRTFIQVCRDKVREKEQRGSKGITSNNIEEHILRCVRLGYLLFCIIPHVGHYPKMGAQILS